MKKKIIKPNYCRGIIIAHGKSELLFANYIKSNLHLPLEIESENNGKRSIQIDGLLKLLNNTVYKNKSSFMRNYIVEEKDGNFVNFRIMPVMDLDDSEQIAKYISGELFEGHWLSKYIVPIWNNENFDKVFYDLKLINKIPKDNEKGKVYEKLFPKNTGKTDEAQVRELMEKLKTSDRTNLEECIGFCLNIFEKMKNKEI